MKRGRGHGCVWRGGGVFLGVQEGREGRVGAGKLAGEREEGKGKGGAQRKVERVREHGNESSWRPASRPPIPLASRPFLPLKSS